MASPVSQKLSAKEAYNIAGPIHDEKVLQATLISIERCMERIGLAASKGKLGTECTLETGDSIRHFERLGYDISYPIHSGSYVRFVDWHRGRFL